jgi:hypothetical protein
MRAASRRPVFVAGTTGCASGVDHVAQVIGVVRHVARPPGKPGQNDARTKLRRAGRPAEAAGDAGVRLGIEPE